MGAAMERLAAHIRRQRTGDADLEQHLAVERALAHEMAAIVGQVDRIIRPHMEAVSPRILAFAPRPQEFSVAVEHHDRMLAAVEGIDIVLVVDPDGGNLLEGPAVGELRPILDDAVLEVAGTYDLCHCVLPQCTRSYFCNERM